MFLFIFLISVIFKNHSTFTFSSDFLISFTLNLQLFLTLFSSYRPIFFSINSLSLFSFRKSYSSFSSLSLHLLKNNFFIYLEIFIPALRSLKNNFFYLFAFTHLKYYFLISTLALIIEFFFFLTFVLFPSILPCFIIAYFFRI